MKELFFNYKIVRIIVISLLIIISLSLVIVIFFKFYPPFGGNPSYKDKEDYDDQVISIVTSHIKKQEDNKKLKKGQ